LNLPYRKIVCEIIESVFASPGRIESNLRKSSFSFLSNKRSKHEIDY